MPRSKLISWAPAASAPWSSWRRGEFPHRAESRFAGAPRHANRRTILEARRPRQTREQHSFFGSRRDQSRDQGFVEFAVGISSVGASAFLRVVAAAEVGDRLDGPLCALVPGRTRRG